MVSKDKARVNGAPRAKDKVVTDNKVRDNGEIKANRDMDKAVDSTDGEEAITTTRISKDTIKLTTLEDGVNNMTKDCNRKCSRSTKDTIRIILVSWKVKNFSMLTAISVCRWV